ncbi:hypothetical protein Tco_0832932 [Tanacetum coccineum]
MLRDTTKNVLRIGSLKDGVKKFVTVTLKLLMVQYKLHHLPLEFVKDFNNALLMFIRRTVIKNMVKDIQLGVESYQRTLNLTKPTMFFERIDQRIPFTMTAMHKGVMYENLIDMLSKNKLGSGNKRLKGRDWTDYDVKSSKEMLKKIDEILRHRDQLRRLKEGVTGEVKDEDELTLLMAKHDEQEERIEPWHIDSAASTHMAGEEDLFMGIEKSKVMSHLEMNQNHR